MNSETQVNIHSHMLCISELPLESFKIKICRFYSDLTLKLDTRAYFPFKVKVIQICLPSLQLIITSHIQRNEDMYQNNVCNFSHVYELPRDLLNSDSDSDSVYLAGVSGSESLISFQISDGELLACKPRGAVISESSKRFAITVGCQGLLLEQQYLWR